jgi:hypothetical protein
MPLPTHLLYLHGFRSSPQSFKAQRLASWVKDHAPHMHWWCPQLPPSPREAMAMVQQGTADWPTARMAAIGSSLGGYYATALAESRGCKAMLLNPAIDPARDLGAYVGEQTMFHHPEQTFQVRPDYMDELRALRVPAITRPERYSAIIAKGDEVLSWHEMSAHYPGARVLLLEGSDHSITDFDTHLPFLLEFLQS